MSPDHMLLHFNPLGGAIIQGTLWSETRKHLPVSSFLSSLEKDKKRDVLEKMSSQPSLTSTPSLLHQTSARHTKGLLQMASCVSY